jgi:FdhE protein
MRRTAPGLLEDLEPLIAAAGTRHPEWHVLIDAWREIARVAPAPEWADAAERAVLPTQRPVNAPILDRAAIPAPAEAIATLLEQLSGWDCPPAAAVKLVEASIAQDRGGTDEIAAAAGRDADALATSAALAAMPLLQACARVHESRIPAAWTRGYCPVCGAWPVLAELVGIDRSRRVRCGRCAAAWALPPLQCPFCGEHDHERLGSLVPEATRETRFVETCNSCGGYIKTLTTLQSCGALELAIRDLDTVVLDLAALDRGLARPDGLGFPMRVTLTA